MEPILSRRGVSRQFLTRGRLVPAMAELGLDVLNRLERYVLRGRPRERAGAARELQQECAR
jgi:hypothetical protein